ncbi:hypothetical protein M8J77_011482 [Diaphorina citri]|nr:hypothetical protein M8J77_011482 [Diaphorina citri]
MFNFGSLFTFIFVTVVVFFLCVVYSHGQTTEETKSLPFCGDPKPPDKEKSLVFVSTLDGYVSALNLLDGGSESWSIPTEPGPMLSSSIHRLELTNSGHWVRMIPSLSGGLYKFNGENLEPIPITADNLLEASFRYSDDVVISGGKESRSYGVDVETGKILYECSMNQCGNTTPSVVSKDMIILQRLTQTVRAVEPRSGNERWNFSVGQHDLKFLPDENSDCHHNVRPPVQVHLKVIVPEGLLCAMSKEEPNKVLWQHKFGSPIVNAWRLDSGRVEIVDLFGSPQVDDDDIPESPDVYVGMHNKQLYIQESVAMQKKLQSSSMRYQQHLLTDETNFPRIPWHPIPATSSHLLGLPHIKEEKDITALAQLKKDVTQTTALSVLYASEYVNGNGYFLYSTDSRKAPEKGGQCAHKGTPSDNNMTITTEQNEEADDEEDDDPYGGLPVQIININISFWYWWKEVLITSLLMAIAGNMLINKRLYRFLRYYLSNQKHDLLLPTQITPSIPSSDLASPRKSSESSTYDISSYQQGQDYVSRYLTDFEPVHCLGRGGFGVVFQAVNRIDDCDYAIKRITLRQESRDRVMREVKALAKLDHQHIVRYFNAWLECPPEGWQEEQDKTWKDKARDDFLSSLDEQTSADLTQSKPSASRTKNTNQKPTAARTNPVKPAGSLFTNNFITNSAMFRNLSNSLRYRQTSNTMDHSDSVVFEHSQESESLSSLLSPAKGKAVPDDDEDSYIQFEASQADTHGVQSSVIDISSSSGGKDKLQVPQPQPRKRPNSLSIGPVDSGTGSSKLYLYIQMQLCRKDSLREWLADNVTHRDRTEIVSIFEQIVQAVEYVHMQGLIHRDLKPSNIFFSQEGQIKVGDFGLVTAMMSDGDVSPLISTKTGYVDERHTAKVGTQLYMSPEQMAGKSYNYKVDIYSLGMIFFELLIPFHTQMERWKMLSDLRNNVYPAHFNTSYPKEYELLQSMLASSPDKRVTTYGIRARAPLGDLHPDNKIDPRWHYELPRGHLRTPSFGKSHSSSSSTSTE